MGRYSRTRKLGDLSIFNLAFTETPILSIIKDHNSGPFLSHRPPVHHSIYQAQLISVLIFIARKNLRRSQEVLPVSP